MKQYLLLLLSLTLVIFSCSVSDNPIPVVEDAAITLKETKADFTNKAGVKTISFVTNKSWTAKSDATWCTLSPSSGDASVKSIMVTVATNDTYDDRNCTVTFSVGGLSKTLAVSQSQLNAVIVSEKTHDLLSDSQTLEVKLQTNVAIEVVVPTKAQSWVQHTETRALTTKTVVLNIAKNATRKDRSTEVYFKDKATSLQDTISIKQYGRGLYFVKQMGTLGEMLNQTQKDTITTMIVRGEINKADFDVMKLQMPQLRYIDLKDVMCEDDKIPDSAFGGEKNSMANEDISTIILPDKLVAIGEFAFSSCSGLTSELILPNGLITIGNNAFYRCSDLTGDLVFPDGLTTIGHRAFYVCSGLTGNLIIPDGVTRIGHRAFEACSGLDGDLILPDNLTNIEEYAFRSCSGLTGLKLGSNVTTISKGLFYGCHDLTGRLIIPHGVTTIEEDAFAHCSGFTGHLIIPNSVTTIESSAFVYCRGFTQLKLGSNVTTIGEGAFDECTGFTGNLIIPDNVTSIENGAFFRCSGFTGDLVIPNSITKIGDVAFYECRGFSGLKLGNNVTTIGNRAFIDCTNISGKVVFPTTLEAISQEAFRGCNKVEAFRFPHTSTLQYSQNMLPSEAKVEVPDESVGTYQSSDGWRNHTIVGY